MMLTICRYSDHIAALNAFQSWEEARQSGEDAEINFCDHKGLNMPTLRTTWEAKNQLRDLLVTCGIPEECLTPQVSFKFYIYLQWHVFFKVTFANKHVPFV